MLQNPFNRLILGAGTLYTLANFNQIYSNFNSISEMLFPRRALIQNNVHVPRIEIPTAPVPEIRPNQTSDYIQNLVDAFIELVKH